MKIFIIKRSFQDSIKILNKRIKRDVVQLGIIVPIVTFLISFYGHNYLFILWFMTLCGCFYFGWYRSLKIRKFLNHIIISIKIFENEDIELEVFSRNKYNLTFPFKLVHRGKIGFWDSVYQIEGQNIFFIENSIYDFDLKVFKA